MTPAPLWAEGEGGTLIPMASARKVEAGPCATTELAIKVPWRIRIRSLVIQIVLFAVKVGIRNCWTVEDSARNRILQKAEESMDDLATSLSLLRETIAELVVSGAASLCCLCVVVDFIRNPNVVVIAILGYMFVYALTRRPVASSSAWKVVLCGLYATLLLKFLFHLEGLFCFCSTVNGMSVHLTPYCSNQGTLCLVKRYHHKDLFAWDCLVGLSSPSNSFFGFVFWDFLCVFAVTLVAEGLARKGLWRKSFASPFVVESKKDFPERLRQAASPYGYNRFSVTILQGDLQEEESVFRVDFDKESTLPAESMAPPPDAAAAATGPVPLGERPTILPVTAGPQVARQCVCGCRIFRRRMVCTEWASVSSGVEADCTS